MSTQEFFEGVTTFFDLAGVAVLLGGLVLAVVVSARSVVRRDSASVTVVVFRSTFGRALLLSLEILIAADLTRTLTVDPTLENVFVLGVIVIIRSVLSISLDIEMEGVVPWRRRAVDAEERREGET
ncbi:MAG: DUF1622 domain-containing protein [Actinomycetia bacterium]|nr:DUF1622 domain-containing protein [Actinomycetes bacterium]